MGLCLGLEIWVSTFSWSVEKIYELDTKGHALSVTQGQRTKRFAEKFKLLTNFVLFLSRSCFAEKSFALVFSDGTFGLLPKFLLVPSLLGVDDFFGVADNFAFLFGLLSVRTPSRSASSVGESGRQVRTSTGRNRNSDGKLQQTYTSSRLLRRTRRTRQMNKAQFAKLATLYCAHFVGKKQRDRCSPQHAFAFCRGAHALLQILCERVQIPVSFSEEKSENDHTLVTSACPRDNFLICCLRRGQTSSSGTRCDVSRGPFPVVVVTGEGITEFLGDIFCFKQETFLNGLSFFFVFADFQQRRKQSFQHGRVARARPACLAGTSFRKEVGTRLPW